MGEVAVLGTIVNTVGLQGELKLYPSPDFWPEALESEGLSIVGDGGASSGARVTSWRWKGNTIVFRLAGVTTVDAARALVGSRVELALADVAPGKGPDRFLPCQFIGLDVRLPDGSLLGVVVDLLLGPAQDCLVVEREGQRYLVPQAPGIVKRVAIEEGVIEIEPPAGLTDLRW